MATKLSDYLRQLDRELRYEPTSKRVRALLDGHPVLDSRGAVLVWEPRRVVPCYAVPVDGVVGVLSPAESMEAREPAPPVLHPGIPFTTHSTPGTSLDVSAGGQTAEAAAFRFDDPELAGIVAFDPRAFNWLEEDDPVQGHPRSPFHRVDIRHSSRHVRVSAGGAVIAESAAPLVVFETGMSERIYVPPADVDWNQLIPTESETLCPYKGTASYWRLAGGSGEDVAWSYVAPLPPAAEMAGYLCFYDNLATVEQL